MEWIAVGHEWFDTLFRQRRVKIETSCLPPSRRFFTATVETEESTAAIRVVCQAIIETSQIQELPNPDQ